MINGTECEPYITADDTLMQRQADALVEGALILAYVVGAERVVIGIEDNKPAAIARRDGEAVHSARADIEVASFPTKYPSGGEKQFYRNTHRPAGAFGRHSGRHWPGVRESRHRRGGQRSDC